MEKAIEKIASPISDFLKFDEDGDELFKFQFSLLDKKNEKKAEHLGVNLLAFETVLKNMVSQKVKIETNVTIESINSEPEDSGETVVWKSCNETFSETFDVVLLSNEASSVRQKIYGDVWAVRPTFRVDEFIIRKPSSFNSNSQIEQTDMTRRVGFFPIGPPQDQQIYVYLHTLIQNQDFQDFEPKIISSDTTIFEQFSNFNRYWPEIYKQIQIEPPIIYSYVSHQANLIETSSLKRRILLFGNSTLNFCEPFYGFENVVPIFSAYSIAYKLLTLTDNINTILKDISDITFYKNLVILSINSSNHLALKKETTFYLLKNLRLLKFLFNLRKINNYLNKIQIWLETQEVVDFEQAQERWLLLDLEKRKELFLARKTLIDKNEKQNKKIDQDEKGENHENNENENKQKN